MSEPETLEPAPEPEIATNLDFERSGADEFALTVNGKPVLILSERIARWLAAKIDAELGSAWARTMKQS